MLTLPSPRCLMPRSTLRGAPPGYFSGKSHSFKASVSSASQPTSALYNIEGEWAGKSSFKGKSPNGSSNSTFHDASSSRRDIEVAPLDQQGDMESRKVWAKVAEGIRKQDYDNASKEKTRIENEQRDKRKKEGEKGTPHQLEYFVHVDEDQEYAALLGKAKGVASGYPAKQDAYRRKPRVH